MSRHLYLDNDFEPEYKVTRKNTNTGAEEPAAGLSGLTIRISATDGGVTIHADLSVNASERSSEDGMYYGLIDGDALRNRLAESYIDATVWVVFGDGTNVLVSDAYVVKERRRSGDK